MLSEKLTPPDLGPYRDAYVNDAFNPNAASAAYDQLSLDAMIVTSELVGNDAYAAMTARTDCGTCQGCTNGCGDEPQSIPFGSC